MKDIEVICVDAGSTDGTAEIVKQYAERDRRVRYVHVDVKSYGYQMNKGIEIAKGEYIGFVDYQWEKDLGNLKNKMFDVSLTAANKYVIVKKEEKSNNKI